ncbi:nitroreductase family protein [Halostagnicola sp. A-GB9-2]|uniref:nitroreductase family protein n=1 Tax=Halostagnicola sp. A-GB9-2 TaxID=3048066 RepID=UPI0024C07585|nr:nitroreductase family protein [Halostagnicola sp. A-GB9-2]MDJ1433806.1 nitroreductase family protein [Halostagnicola sp. A-GB9-2]
MDNWPSKSIDLPVVPDLTGWFTRRDSVRDFDPEREIADAEIRTIVDAGRKAPTTGALQMYSFVHVSEEETLEVLKECSGGTQEKIVDASHFLVACIDLRRTRQFHASRELPFELSSLSALLKGAVDVAMAAHGILTVAESRGYGVCPVGAISEDLDGVAAAIDLPELVLPVFGLCIGLPAGGGPDRSTSRVPLDMVFHDEGYSDPDAESIKTAFAEMNKRYPPDMDWDFSDSLSQWWTPAPDGWMNAREGVLRAALVQQGFLETADDGSRTSERRME